MTEPYYRDEWVTIWHGDCREVLPSIEIAPDLTVADPPYAETSLEWDRWPNGWLEAIPTDCRQLWCFGSMRMFLQYGGEFSQWTFAQDLIWEKHNGSSFHADRFKRVHEHVAHWYRGPWTDLHRSVVTTPDATKRASRRKARPPHMGVIGNGDFHSSDGGPRLMRSVIRCSSMHGQAQHPTEKPVGIVGPLLDYSLPAGGLVLDPMAGSGTVLVAAKSRAARAVGIEAREHYCEIAAKRCAQGVLDFGVPS